jgi:hypothetical protein
MAASANVHGEISQYKRPVWEPLHNLIGDELGGDWMWMHEIKMATGEQVHAYKHIDARRYIHLSEVGRAYVYVDGNKYRSIPALEAAALALPREAVLATGSRFGP